MTDDPSSGYNATNGNWPDADAAWAQWGNAIGQNGNTLTQQQRAVLTACAANLSAAIDSAERSYRIQISQQNNPPAQADAQQLKATAQKEFALCNLADALNGSNGTPATGGASAGGSGAPIQGGVNTGSNGASGSGAPGTPGGPLLKTGTSFTEPGFRSGNTPFKFRHSRVRHPWHWHARNWHTGRPAAHRDQRHPRSKQPHSGHHDWNEQLHQEPSQPSQRHGLLYAGQVCRRRNVVGN